MKYAVLCSLVALCTTTLSSQANMLVQESRITEKTQTEAVAGSAADKAELRALLGDFASLSANFTQTINDMQGEELQVTSGKLLLQKPQKLRWEITSPDESLLIADGSSVFNVDPFLGQVTIVDQAQLTKSNPLMLLISDKQEQWDQVVVNKENMTFNIVSLQADSPIRKLKLSFSEENKLQSLVSIDRQQQQSNLQFDMVKLNQGLSQNDFRYTVEEGFIVDDQRASPIN